MIEHDTCRRGESTTSRELNFNEIAVKECPDFQSQWAIRNLQYHVYQGHVPHIPGFDLKTDANQP